MTHQAPNLGNDKIFSEASLGLAQSGRRYHLWSRMDRGLEGGPQGCSPERLQGSPSPFPSLGVSSMAKRPPMMFFMESQAPGPLLFPQGGLTNSASAKERAP